MTMVMEEESISLVLDKGEEPISVEVAIDSTMVIIHQEEPTTVSGEMTSAKTIHVPPGGKRSVPDIQQVMMDPETNPEMVYLM